MPHVFALVIAGAGLYAGFKWVSRQYAQMQDAVRQQEADLREAVARGGRAAPKDLGNLELDPKSGVYRPREK